MSIELVLFDVGGVLGSNGWDRGERAAAVREFELDRDRFEARHAAVVDAWEAGRVTLDEYLTRVVFDVPRPFTREEFRAFMLAQSVPDDAMIAVARRVRDTGRYRLMTLNNESAELQWHRAHRFGLIGLFDAFLTSCYLAVRKPHTEIYERALGIAGIEPPHVVFIDDREENLEPARALGMHTVHATGSVEVQRALGRIGVLDGVAEHAAGSRRSFGATR